MNAVDILEGVAMSLVRAIDGLLIDTQVALERLENQTGKPHEWKDGMAEVLKRLPKDKRREWYESFTKRLDADESEENFPTIVWLRDNL